MHGRLRARPILQHLIYHRQYAGVEHAIVYDAGAVDEDMRRAFRPLMKEGFLEVTEYRESVQWDVWYLAQVSG